MSIIRQIVSVVAQRVLIELWTALTDGCASSRRQNPADQEPSTKRPHRAQTERKKMCTTFCATLSQMHNKKSTGYFKSFLFIWRKKNCAHSFPLTTPVSRSVCASVVVAISSGMSRAIAAWPQQADWPLPLTTVCANHKKRDGSVPTSHKILTAGSVAPCE